METSTEDFLKSKINIIFTYLWSDIKDISDIFKRYDTVFGRDEIYWKLREMYSNNPSQTDTIPVEELRLVTEKMYKEQNNKVNLTKEFIDNAIIEENDFKLDESAYVVISELLFKLPPVLFFGSRYEIMYNLLCLRKKSKLYGYIHRWIKVDIELYKTSAELKAALATHMIEHIVSPSINTLIQLHNGRDNIPNKTITGSMIRTYLDSDIQDCF